MVSSGKANYTVALFTKNLRLIFIVSENLSFCTSYEILTCKVCSRISLERANEKSVSRDLLIDGAGS